jgi:hypothetical protein
MYAGIYFNYTKADVRIEIKAECIGPGSSKALASAKTDLVVNQMLPRQGSRHPCLTQGSGFRV